MAQNQIDIGLHEGRIEGLCEEGVGIIGAQDGKRLGAGLHLHLASLLTLFPIGISGGALLLQHHEESLVSSDGFGFLKRLKASSWRSSQSAHSCLRVARLHPV